MSTSTPQIIYLLGIRRQYLGLKYILYVWNRKECSIAISPLCEATTIRKTVRLSTSAVYSSVSNCRERETVSRYGGRKYLRKHFGAGAENISEHGIAGWYSQARIWWDAAIRWFDHTMTIRQDQIWQDQMGWWRVACGGLPLWHSHVCAICQHLAAIPRSHLGLLNGCCERLCMFRT